MLLLPLRLSELLSQGNAAGRWGAFVVLTGREGAQTFYLFPTLAYPPPFLLLILDLTKSTHAIMTMIAHRPLMN